MARPIRVTTVRRPTKDMTASGPPDQGYNGPPPDQGYNGPPPGPGYYGPPPRRYHEGDYEDSCRRDNNTAGTLFGMLAGGLIGSAASHGNGGAVVGGAILGGIFGNAVTHDMPCEDHPYAFRVYAQGLDGDIASSATDSAWSGARFSSSAASPASAAPAPGGRPRFAAAADAS